MRAEVDVNLDDVLEGIPAIIGPTEDCHGWVLHLPGKVPCICDSFEDAAEAMRKWVSRLERRPRQ